MASLPTCNFYFLIPCAPVAFGLNVYDRWDGLHLHHVVGRFPSVAVHDTVICGLGQWACVLGNAPLLSASIVQLLSSKSSAPKLNALMAHYFPFLPGHCPSKYTAQQQTN